MGRIVLMLELALLEPSDRGQSLCWEPCGRRVQGHVEPAQHHTHRQLPGQQICKRARGVCAHARMVAVVILTGWRNSNAMWGERRGIGDMS